uniref:Ligated ion channel binding I - glutamate n=1 Tax=Polyphagotarsonemus latus TaxID=1204166 RepID=A0AAN0LHB2_9ACAR
MNYTVRIAIPEIKPYIVINNDKIFSQYELFYELISLLPTFKKKIIGLEYRLGTKNETGHYNGMIGKLQNDEVDLIYYPLPIDMSDPPGFLTKVFFESSTYIMNLANIPLDKHKDLFNSLFNLNLEIIFLFLFFLIFLSVFTSQVLKLFFSFFEALFFLLCLTFKKSIAINYKFRAFSYSMILYSFILMTIFESNVNSNLIIKVKTNIIDSIDDLYAKVDNLPIFFKDHFTTYYFNSPYSNKKFKVVYQRALNCKDCIKTIEEHMSQFVSPTNDNLKKKVFILDQTMIKLFKNIVCTFHHEKINSLGFLHTSSYIFKNQFGYLMNRKISFFHRKEINKRLTDVLESGIIIKVFENVDNLSPLGKKQYNLSIEKCLKSNDKYTNKIIEKKLNTVKLFDSIKMTNSN